jgi:hypothetical protein
VFLVAEYVSSWPTYATLPIASNGNCILARDLSAGAVNNIIPTQNLTYENDIW